MKVRFWGVRGSTPTPQLENMHYGGNTSCVEVRIHDQIYIFDCGTGFRNLGKSLIAEYGAKPIYAHVFLSHFHWDHIQGIPFFQPLYENPDNYFFFHSSSRTRGLQRAIEEQMADPYFPVDMTEMAAHCNFYDIEEERVAFDNCIVESMWLNHPQGCLGFRLESDNAVFVYATDNEPGHPVFDRNVRKLAEGADLLVYDAQYLPSEYETRRRGWGHSHWREAVDIAQAAGVKELVLYHHDPDHDDPCVDAIVQSAAELFPRVRAAREGAIIEL
jgi:phosphoribosyl 1,2-cyclic phosphodiesterase